MSETPADWKRLIAISVQLGESPDATGAIIIEVLSTGTDYRKVVSRQQAWNNKYARCAQRDLISVPFRIRRSWADDGTCVIEAVRDLTPGIEQAMVMWPHETGDE